MPTMAGQPGTDVEDCVGPSRVQTVDTTPASEALEARTRGKGPRTHDRALRPESI
jgi:hypothetical protein